MPLQINQHRYKILLLSTSGKNALLPGLGGTVSRLSSHCRKECLGPAGRVASQGDLLRGLSPWQPLSRDNGVQSRQQVLQLFFKGHLQSPAPLQRVPQDGELQACGNLSPESDSQLPNVLCEFGLEG